MPVKEGDLLWTPSEDFMRDSQLGQYMRFLRTSRGLSFDNYQPLWQWSVDCLDDFWQSQSDHWQVLWRTPPNEVLAARSMPGAQWFSGGTLNYAEHVFRHLNEATRNKVAVVFETETPVFNHQTVTWGELHTAVARFAGQMRRLGVTQGDRVAAYIPNTPYALIAFLACASIGAIWSSCSPDIGAEAVSDRFSQIEPKLLITIDGYVYNGKRNDRKPVVQALIAALPSLKHVIHIAYLDAAVPMRVSGNLLQQHDWTALMTTPNFEVDLAYAPLAFDHPLWVLYSSGTTGLPKPITHSQGGIVLGHLKSLGLHSNIGPNSVFFWFSTTGWMMWNYLIGGLLMGSTIVLYDGSPGLHNMNVLWSLAERAGVTVFGTSAAYVTACMKAGLAPAHQHDLSKLQAIGSTGSPLPVEAYEYVYNAIKPDVWLFSMSGGTDVCDAFVGGCALLPVYAGEIQCRCLGCNIQALDELGESHIDAVGELCLTSPMPSMPVFFWNDPLQRRYKESYFEMYPGIWRHGDWVKITPRNSLVIYGRSDSTINRQGVRIGSSEIYRVVEALPEVSDSLIIDLEMLGRASYMPLFVVMSPGYVLDDAMREKIVVAIRGGLSARQVPDAIIAIDEVPRTLNGKKMEVPIKKIMLGVSPHKAVTLGSMANPQSLEPFLQIAKTMNL